MSLRRSMIFSLGGLPPLDEVGATSSTALLALGLRKLSRSYTGNALQVRNNVGAIGNLAFDSNDEVSASSIVTITAGGTGFTVGSTHNLTAFASGGNVTVRIWYDQSGNNRHISQSTVGNQPYLMLNGNFVQVNNKVSLFTNSEVRYFVNTSGDFNFWYYSQGGSMLITKSNSQFPLAQNLRGRYCGASGGWWGFRVSTQTPAEDNNNYYITAYNRFRTEEYTLNCSDPTDQTFYLIGDASTGVIEPRFFNVQRTNFFNNSSGSIITYLDNNTAVKTDATTFRIGISEQAGIPTPGSFMRAYLNGTASSQFNYVQPRVNVTLTSLFMFNPATTSYPNPEKMQELILFGAQNNFSERSIVEKNMGRYYNVTVV